ncbi:MAG: prepilin peptidase [Terriglobales bacterium]
MLWRDAVLAAALAAAVWDLRWSRIPKWLTLPAAAAGLIYHGFNGGLAGALVACGLGLGVGLVLQQLGAVAGGDVKWLAALGALLGLRLWFWSIEFGLLAAGLIALGQMAYRGRLTHLLDDLAVIVRGWRQYGLHGDPEHSVTTPGAVVAPFAVALLAGVLCALFVI